MWPVTLLLLFFSLELKASDIPPLRFVTEALPPYQVTHQDQLTSGSTFTLVNKAMNLAEITQDIEVYPWARAYHIAKTTPNVVIFSMVRCEQRESHFLWLHRLNTLTFQFYSSSQHKEAGMLTLDNIGNKVAAVVRGSFEEVLLKKLGFEQRNTLITTSDTETMWALLDKGSVDLVYASTIPEQIEQYSQHEFVKEAPFIGQYGLYIAANRNSDKHKIEAFRRAIVAAQGELD